MWKLYPFSNYFLATDRDYTTNEIWDITKEMGFQKAYFSCNTPDLSIAEKIKENRIRTGLDLAAVYVVLELNQENLGRDFSISNLMDCLQAGDILDIGLSMGWEKELSDPRHDELAIKTLIPILNEAKKRGIQISLYHHLNFWMERIEDCVRIAKKIDDPSLGVTFCGYHWFAVDGSDLKSKLKLACPYLKLVNICGSQLRKSETEFPLPYTIEPVGYGDFPLRDFLSGLLEIGYKGDIGFQGFKIGGNPKDSLTKSIVNFKEAYSELA